ncbi:MAG: hypothetical protein QXZ70_00775 [Candidatus Bathyarchaeia archaeon]
MDSRKTSLTEEIYEIICIVKACLTSFWFWLPVLFAIFLCGQLLLICIHPLLLLVSPTILTIYAILQEDKRFEECYGANERKVVFSSDPLGSLPHVLNPRIEKEAVEEYAQLLKKKHVPKD